MLTTTLNTHGMHPGDIISVHESRWQKLRKLLTRPRVTFVWNVNVNSFTIAERRMTWREWLRAMQAAIVG